MKKSKYSDVRNSPYWNLFGDNEERIEFGDLDSLALQIYTFDAFPNVSHIVPVECYAGSRFDGSAVWSEELATCKLLAYARLTHWDFELAK